MGDGATTPREPVTIDVGTDLARGTAMGGAILGVLGLASLVAAFTAADSTGTRVLAIVVGLVLAGLGILPAFLWKRASQPRHLVLDADALRWEQPEGTSWAVAWPELAEITLTCPPPGANQPRMLVLRPADPAFFDAHPEMAEFATKIGLEKKDAYVMRLGSTTSIIRPLDRALAAFAPDRYHREGPEIR